MHPWKKRNFSWDGLKNKTLSGFPAGRMGVTKARADARRLLVGRYPGWQNDFRRLPRHLFQGAQWLIDESGAGEGAICLTVAGAAQVTAARRA